MSSTTPSRFDNLEGKVALVTGGSSGLGEAVVARFVEAGATVTIVDVQAPPDAGPAKFLQGDVSDREELRKAFAEVKATYGRLDILVSNAAVQPHGVSLEDTTPELLDLVFRVNCFAVFYGLQLAREFMESGGTVIHASSFVGSVGVPDCPSYAASKAAVDHLTRVGAIELADRGITVNAVAPGVVLTPAVAEIPDNPEVSFVKARTPLARVPAPEEIAPLFVYLASEAARFLTGAVIPFDGGIAAGWNEYALTPPPQWKNGQWNP
ncbi:MAG: SDR family oxidoreductase [Verrucomicrobiota bacterium]